MPRFSRIKKIGASLFLLSALLLPVTPAFAATVQFSCWCQDATSLTCNHHLVDSRIEQTDTSWTAAGIGLLAGPVGVVIGGASYGVDALLERSQFASRRATISGLCIDRCRADGGKRAINFDTSYREDRCQACAADSASSCTEAQGARAWSATHATSSRAVLPQCPTEVTSVFPIQLGVKIGGVGEVNGLAEYINLAYRYLVTVVLTVAIIMVVWGGFKYLLGASMSSIQSGKETIKDALIGMMLVLGAYMILSTVNPATTVLKLPSIERVACKNLDIPPALASDRCNEDSDCASGVHCVQTQFVFRTDLDEVVGSAVRLGSAAGAQTGTYLVGDNWLGNWAGSGIGTLTAAAGAGWYALFNMGGHIKVCSTGEDGAPCNATSNCKPGLLCLRKWNLCTKPAGIARGKPCGDTDVQTGRDSFQQATCVNNSECVKPADTRWFESLAGPDYKTCRGNSQPMLSITGYVNNSSRVPENNACITKNDCAMYESHYLISGPPVRITNIDCIGSEIPRRGKYCYFAIGAQASLLEDDNLDATGRGTIGALSGESFTIRPGETPCVRPGSAVAVTSPRLCDGGSRSAFTCAYCPATGTRTWTYLAPGSEAAKTQIGVCDIKQGEPGSRIGTRCGP